MGGIGGKPAVFIHFSAVSDFEVRVWQGCKERVNAIVQRRPFCSGAEKRASGVDP